MTAWTAVIEQLLDGRRSGAFSWHKAVEKEVRGYIADLDEPTRRKIWESHSDSRVLRDANLDTITYCLYAIIFQATLPRIHRAVDYRRRRANQRLEATPDEPYDDT